MIQWLRNKIGTFKCKPNLYPEWLTDWLIKIFFFLSNPNGSNSWAHCPQGVCSIPRICLGVVRNMACQRNHIHFGYISLSGSLFLSDSESVLLLLPSPPALERTVRWVRCYEQINLIAYFIQVKQLFKKLRSAGPPKKASFTKATSCPQEETSLTKCFFLPYTCRCILKLSIPQSILKFCFIYKSTSSFLKLFYSKTVFHLCLWLLNVPEN